MPKPFRQIKTNDRVLETIQQNVQASIGELSKSPELNASYIELTTAADTDLIVNHLLGRAFQYYEVVRKSAAVDVWDSSTVNNNPTKQLILRASGTVTITLKVY